MSLLKRLIVAYLAIVLVLAAAMAVVVREQRAHLEEQIDQELRASSGFVGPVVFAEDFFPMPGQVVFEETLLPEGTPISDLFVAVVDESGETISVLEGALLDDAPKLGSLNLVVPSGDDLAPIQTIASADGDTRFRAVADPVFAGEWIVAALPLTDADDAIRRLIVALLIGSGLVLAALAMTTAWVVRLGLRPMAEMAAAAGEIAAGRRDVRVDYDDQRTEVGQLGRALNEMLDQRDQSENRLRQFAADASHELRTPLTSIRGGLDLLADNDLPADRRDDVVRRVRSESLRMHELVEDLLLLASLDSGRPLRQEPVALLPLINDAADDARALQPERLIEVTTGTHGQADGSAFLVSGDEMRLRQVVSGLVHNALAHTPADAQLRLSLSEDGSDVLLSVADDGPGMAAEQAATVFDRFSRGDVSRSRNAGGAGLGLAIAQSIMAAHDGSLELETAPGKGSTFTMRLRSASSES